MSYPKLIENVIDEFSKLPGVGRRSAERMAFWFLGHSREEAQEIAQSIIRLKEGLQFCSQCNHLTDTTLCSICRDDRRQCSVLCVVEDPKDVIAIEKTGAFKGLYHVLLGAISPGEGRGPDDIRIQQLLNRIRNENIQELILATDADNDGEMTALYILKLLKGAPVKISRIGVGIPMGSSVEYADLSSLGMSITSRREMTQE